MAYSCSHDPQRTRISHRLCLEIAFQAPNDFKKNATTRPFPGAFSPAVADNEKNHTLQIKIFWSKLFFWCLASIEARLCRHVLIFYCSLRVSTWCFFGKISEKKEKKIDFLREKNFFFWKKYFIKKNFLPKLCLDDL